MERFTVIEHGKPRKWWIIMDNGYPDCPACYDHQQVGINFANRMRAQTVANLLNAEWKEFEQNPW